MTEKEFNWKDFCKWMQEFDKKWDNTIKFMKEMRVV